MNGAFYACLSFWLEALVSFKKDVASISVDFSLKICDFSELRKRWRKISRSTNVLERL